MDPSGLALTASSSATFFYIVGGILVVLALAITFVGMRREDFPSGRALGGILGLVTLVVVLVAAGAVVSARDEQEERRENEEAAKEAQAETEANEEATAEEGAGEAAEPAPDAGTAVDGAQVFVDAGCGSCHVLADAGTDGRVGPSLDEVLPGQDPEAIRSSIVEPGAQITEGFPAGAMPANYGDTLSEEELEALVAYLAQTAGS